MLTNDIMIEKEINGHKYLQFKKLLELNINHVFTENDLNFSFKNIPSEENLHNFDIVCKDFGFNKTRLCRPIQKHTAEIKKVTVTGLNPDEYDFTDALITDKNDTPLCITTADCVPLIIYDPVKKVIANIHSGWRGTVRGIVENSLNMIINEYHSNKNDLLFFFGPSLCQNCFEVEEDVKNMFEEKFPYVIIKKGNIKDGNQKYYIDNAGTIIKYLLKEGIKKDNIYNANICTCCHKQSLHSYRGKNEEKLGLNITIVTL